MTRTTRRVAMAGTAALLATMISATPSSAATCLATGVTPSSVALGLASRNVTFDVTSVEGEPLPPEARAMRAEGQKLGAGDIATLRKAARARAQAPSQASAGPRVQSGCLAGWLVMGYRETATDPEFLFVAESTQPTWTFRPREYRNVDAGNHFMAFVGFGADEEEGEVMVSRFLFRRATSWGKTFNASPEPAAINSLIKIKGKLNRVDWDTDKFGAYKNTPVWIQFKKAGTTTFVNHKKVRTDKKGLVSTTVKATSDGTWRISFAGTSVSAPAVSPGDYVDVVGRG